MDKIIEASELPEDEKVYLKKDFLGWRVVEPIIDPETKKFSWFRFIFGGKRAFFFLILIIIIATLLYLGFYEQLANAKLVTENPCNYCDCNIFKGG